MEVCVQKWHRAVVRCAIVHGLLVSRVVVSWRQEVGEPCCVCVCSGDDAWLGVDAGRSLPSSSTADAARAAAPVAGPAAAAAGCSSARAGTASCELVVRQTECVQLPDAQHPAHRPAAAAAAAGAPLQDARRAVDTQPDDDGADRRRLHSTQHQWTLRGHRIHRRTASSLGPQGRVSLSWSPWCFNSLLVTGLGITSLCHAHMMTILLPLLLRPVLVLLLLLLLLLSVLFNQPVFPHLIQARLGPPKISL